MKIKTVYYFIFFILFFFCIFLHSGFAQCKIIDNRREALFISYEKTGQVKVNGEAKLQNGVVFRVHNNSNCAIVITTGSAADKFYKPLPANPTVVQRAIREIDYDLPDGALVPDVQYQYQTRKNSGMSMGGDSFFGFNLLGNRSILFEVPLKHLDLRFAGRLVLPFQFAWENENRAKVVYGGNLKHSVDYWNENLPEEVKQKINRHWK